jgi:HptB-dependent secretion and biofilm anti anti-sigma factor
VIPDSWIPSSDTHTPAAPSTFDVAGRPKVLHDEARCAASRIDAGLTTCGRIATPFTQRERRQRGAVLKGPMIQVTEHEDTITLHISGRFDFRLIKEFQQLLTKEPRLWIIDLSAVEYVDSSALGMLLLLRERVRGDAQRIFLRGVQGQPREVLQMAKFDRMFKLS